MTGKSLIDWFTKRQTQLSHRQLLLISGDTEWCQQQSEQLLQQACSPTLLLSKTTLNFASINNHSLITSCQISQYKQQLGTEYDIVIYNAFDGLKPSALYAIEGVIGKSGLLVILCPTFENWAEYEATHCGIAFSFNTQHTTSLFIERMLRILLKDKSVAYINQHENHLPFARVSELLQLEASHIQRLKPNNLLSELSSNQQIAFNDSLNNMKASKSIGLVTAKRGRGKSTLLGRLAAEIVESNSNAEVYITAPHNNNAQRAQIEYKKIVKDLISSNTLQIRKNCRQHIKPELEFIAPDQIYNLPKQSILIVDEAAAIAPSILLYACNKFAHVIMATTVAGYEGSGLGFNLRVLPKLKELCSSLTSSFHHAELHKSLRWFEEDALETLFTNIFAPFVTDLTLPANQSLQRLSQSHLTNAENKQIDTHFHHLDKNWLITHDDILTQVVGLLTQSHYQTTPDDLMRILDASDLHIAVLADSDDLTLQDVLITSVAIVAHEGNISFPPNDQLLEGILSSQRRVNGHLVAQNLTTTFSDDWFMTAKSWRISRIAVIPQFRRLGLGKCLLEYVRHSAERAEVEYLSTSFGLTSELLSFWRSQHYNLMKIGARRDTSSGEHSGIMIAMLSKTADHKFASYHSVAVNDVDYLLQHIVKPHGDTDSFLIMPDIIQKQYDNSGIQTHGSSQATSLHKLRIEQFNAQKRSFSNTAASIYAQLQDKPNETSKYLHTLFERAHKKNLSKEEKQKLLFELRHQLQNK